MSYYIKRNPEIIEAVQIIEKGNELTIDEFPDWVEELLNCSGQGPIVSLCFCKGCAFIQGTDRMKYLELEVGDYICKTPDGDVYNMSKDLFESIYVAK